MLKFTQPLPLSLYIHIPWCIKKCPYCDFNSHRAGKNIPENDYIDALIQDLEQDLPKVWGRNIVSIFIGGGTPSLFSPEGIERLLQAIHARIPFHPDTESTMEANPGTFEQDKFKGFRQAGINRLSIGIQSFQADKLKALGRVHNDDEAMRAVEIARNAGFDNFNLDLMHGLPNQSIDDALFDLNTAIKFNPPHLSWYQLTLEPNTVFAKHPPKLPVDERLWDIQSAGHKALETAGFKQYEISAYSKPEHQCAHNLNYWEFGDYLGIGAGAHSKITDLQFQTATRYVKARNPNDYLNPEKAFITKSEVITAEDMPLEFMMNILRLVDGVPASLLKERAGLDLSQIQKPLSIAKEKGLLEASDLKLKTTLQGQLFLNDCLNLFSS